MSANHHSNIKGNRILVVPEDRVPAEVLVLAEPEEQVVDSEEQVADSEPKEREQPRCWQALPFYRYTESP